MNVVERGREAAFSPSRLAPYLLTHHDPVPATVLAGVQGLVGLVDQGVQVGGFVEDAGDADGDGQAVLGHGLHHRQLADLLLQPFRHHLRVLRVGIRQGNDDLCTAESPDHVIGPDGVLAVPVPALCCIKVAGKRTAANAYPAPSPLTRITRRSTASSSWPRPVSTRVSQWRARVMPVYTSSRVRIGLGVSGSSRAVWVNSEPWDLCTVMANTVSTACRRLGSTHLMRPLPSPAGKATRSAGPW